MKMLRTYGGRTPKFQLTAKPGTSPGIFAKTALAVAACTLTAAPAAAQELRESVEVEGTYIRDIKYPERIGNLPALMDFPVGDGTLDYERRGVNANFSPSAPPISATVWDAGRPATPGRGYLELTLGSWLDANLSAGFAPIRKENERLDIRLQHNSTSLWKPFKTSAQPGSASAADANAADANSSNGSGRDALFGQRRFAYQEQIGVDYWRDFRGKGSLGVSAQYHLGYFNYYFAPQPQDAASPALYALPGIVAPGAESPTQTLNDVAAEVAWRSRESDHSAWNLAAGARYFGYRTATRETSLSLRGGYARKWTSSTRFGFDAEATALLYNSAAQYHCPESYGALRITPFYEWRKNATRLRIGVDLDFAINADGLVETEHYAAFHAAPDVRLDITGNKVGFYVSALGGQTLHTLAGTSQLDPYRNPHLESTLPSYSPIDANMGLTLTPFSGFSARVNLRYQSLRNAPMEGWYAVLLNVGETPLAGLDIPDGQTPLYGRGRYRYNLSGFAVGLNLEYALGRVFRIAFDGSYSAQSGERGIFNGLDRPRWILKGHLEARPLAKLLLALDYEYRGVRNIYTAYEDPDAETLMPGGAFDAIGGLMDEGTKHPGMKLAGMRLADMHNLSFHAAWEVVKNLSITFDVENILNRHEEALPMMTTPGIGFLGGLSFRF